MTGLIKCLSLKWPTMEGVDYTLEVYRDRQWVSLAGPFTGDGTVFETTVERVDSKGFYRLRSEAKDSDGDGLLDWEELLVGLDPMDPRSGDPQKEDLEYVRETLSRGGVVELTSVQPVIRIGEAGEAIIKLRRRDGLAHLSIPLVIDGAGIGNHLFEVTPSVVTFKPHERVKEIRVRIAPEGLFSGGQEISVRIPSSESYMLGHFDRRTITIVRENLVNVEDFGAKGDGVTDDTDSIQSAISALELDPRMNGLYFPRGSYRLARIRFDSDSPLGGRRMLKLGTNRSLSGRDIFLKGESGACLFSDPGPTRVNLLVALASFRSLSIECLRFEKSRQPLNETSGFEPNGASGLAVVAQGSQPIEGVFIRDSEFVNCHSSITLYGNGYDIRGFGGCFHMRNCKVLNPYGANTLNSSSAFGGGQQIAMPAWVADAIYEGCVFEGGGPEMTNAEVSPGGVLKDGCHFGCPLRLVFRGNVVRHMGVEAVFQTSGQAFMGHTEGAFVMPPPDDVSTASVLVSGTPSTYVPGESVNLRTPNIPGSIPSNNRLTIRGFNANTATLSLSNPGSPDNAPQGTSIPLGRPIYKDHRYDFTFALFEGNFVDGTIPPGGVAFATQAGIVSETKCVIRHNFIKGHGSGILNYGTASTPVFPPGRGMLIHDNVIVTRDARSEPSVYTYGIQTFQEDHQIRDNLIVATAAWRTVGIAAHGGNTLALNNTVVADEIAENGYFSPFRSVGVGYGNLGRSFSAQGNATRGFDVGLGSISPNAGIYIPYRARDHRSIQDVLAVDPIGLEPW
jgi:hypothetical protein